LKRKLLIQQQASTSSETELVWKQKMAEYNKLRHINDSVLSSLKMEGICFFSHWIKKLIKTRTYSYLGTETLSTCTSTIPIKEKFQRFCHVRQLLLADRARIV
jgi:hypothetical protein